MKFIRTAIFSAVASTALVFSLSAIAQYQWLDASGRKVFSDQPPPATIPAKRILQKPGKATAAEEKPADIPDVANKPATKALAPEKTASKDKDLEAAKKKLDDEAAAKKKAEEDVQNVARADNCERAKRSKIGLASGVRIAQINAKGEREVMDEAARMVEIKRIEGIITADCKP